MVVPAELGGCASVAGGFFFATVFLAAGFLAGGFLAAGFAGIGICMPGMCWCCAAAGAASGASANALAAMSNLDFTTISPVEEATRRTRHLLFVPFS
jgi:hypothetical protein